MAIGLCGERNNQFRGSAGFAGPASDVLVLLDHGHLNSPGPFGLEANKVDCYVRALRASGLIVTCVLTPLHHWRFPKTREGYLRTERLLTKAFASSVRATFRSSSPHRHGTGLGRHSLGLIYSEALIRRTQARAIMGIGILPELAQVALMNQIPTVEVQHGILGSSTLNLYWPEPIRASGGAPRAIATWDKSYAELASRIGYASVAVGGTLNLVPSDPTKRHSRWGSSAATPEHEVPRRRLLVVCQWGYANGDGEKHGVLKRDVIDTVGKFIGEFGSELVLVRLHPHTAARQNAERVAAWIHSQLPGVQVSNPRSRSLTDDLRESRLILGGPSATVFEAASMGVSSLVLGSFARDELPPNLVKAGLVTQVRVLDYEELREVWLSPPAQPFVPNIDLDVDAFAQWFRANSDLMAHFDKLRSGRPSVLE